MPSAPRQRSDLTTIVELLAQAGVEFVLVGGLAAVAQGAPVATQDVDIVHRRSDENIARLMRVLANLDARYRRPGPEVIRPQAAALRTTGHSLFTTRLGPLNALRSIEQGKTYEDLLPDAISLDVRGLPIRVLSIEAIIANKRGCRHPKDRYVVAILEQTLAERDASG